MELPEWFDSSRLVLDSETFDGMLSIDDKNYVIFDGSKLIKHGSGLKGRHLPIICDKFIDDLCWAVFNDQDVYNVYHKYMDLSKFSPSDFFFTLTLGKKLYKKGTMYAKIAKKADVNASLRLLKTKKGYDLKGKPDYDYYKKRLAELAERITSVLKRPNKARDVRNFLRGQTTMPSSLHDFMRN